MIGLKIVAMIACLLMAIAAINVILVYVLYSVETPGSGIGDILGFLPISLIGAVPFLVTAGFILSAVSRIAIATARNSVLRVRLAAGIGLLPIVVCGFWSGLGAAFLGMPPDSLAAKAVSIYQFTLVAACVGDLVVLVLALATSTRTGPGDSSHRPAT